MIAEVGDAFLVNPIFDRGKCNTFATFNQIDETYRIAHDLIENLNDVSIMELSGGTSGDLDFLLDEILKETFVTLYGTPLSDESNFKAARPETSLLYMQSLTNELEETMRCANLNYFISSVLTGFSINWHHLEWGQLVQQYNKLVVIAPRDHGKSFFFSHAFPIWKTYRYKGVRKSAGRSINDVKNNRGFIISNEMDLTEELLETIKMSIEENDILREKLLPLSSTGGVNKDWWSKRSIRTKNHARINLKSYGGSFRGRHPGWIVCDDMMKDNVIYSEIQRKKLIDYFHSVIMNAIIPGGQVAVVGTPFHAGDLYGDLKQKRGPRGWKVFEYPAISPKGDILWSDRYSYEDLLDKRESQGNIVFSREILCRPIVSDASIFPWEILRRSLIGMEKFTLVKNVESFPIKFKRVVTGCDFAYSSSVGADYSVFSTWGIDQDNRMWLIHFYRGSGKSYRQQVSVIKAINSNFRPDYIVAEANVFQAILVDILQEEGLSNVIPHVTSGQNKHDMLSGLPSMSMMFEQGKVKLPTGDKQSKDVTDFILEEFASIAYTDKGGLESVGMHDDSVMSAWLAKRGGTYLGNNSWGATML